VSHETATRDEPARRVTATARAPKPSPRTIARLGAALVLLAGLGGCTSFLVAIDAESVDDPGERTFYQRLADETIETKAIVNLHAADERYDDAHLTVQSYNGYVLVAGQVPSEDLRQKANEVVREIRDVRRIYNELEVAAASSAVTRASDAWIASKVKTFLLAGRDTPGMRTKVVAEDGVVFLLGLVTREEADRIAAEAADVSGVQRVVRLFEYIDD
jgi:osmotically-inducible protein OsmY